jgi:hypothetical protein
MSSRKQKMFGAMLPSGSGGVSCPTPPAGITLGVITSATSSDDAYVVSNYWKMSFAMMIIPAAELFGAAQITALEFIQNDASAIAWTHPQVVIKMAHTTSSIFTADSFVGTFPNQAICGVSGITTETEVYNSSLSLAASTTWQPITLSTPFCYDGTSNVVISISKGLQLGSQCGTYAPGCGWTYDSSAWQYYQSGSDVGVVYDSDTVVPTGINSTGSGSNGDIINRRANLRIQQ